MLHAAHEKHLKWRHQRRCAGAVKNFGQVVFREVELEQAEVAQIGWNQMLEDGVAESLAEESLVANEHISGRSLRDSSSLTNRSAWRKLALEFLPLRKKLLRIQAG